MPTFAPSGIFGPQLIFTQLIQGIKRNWWFVLKTPTWVCWRWWAKTSTFTKRWWILCGRKVKTSCWIAKVDQTHKDLYFPKMMGHISWEGYPNIHCRYFPNWSPNVLYWVSLPLQGRWPCVSAGCQPTQPPVEGVFFWFLPRWFWGNTEKCHPSK